MIFWVCHEVTKAGQCCARGAHMPGSVFKDDDIPDGRQWEPSTELATEYGSKHRSIFLDWNTPEQGTV